MSAISDAYKSLSDLNLWMKIKSGDNIVLSDIPALIKLRIKYIVQDWELIKKKIIDSQAAYSDPARLQYELSKFDDQVKTFRVRQDALDLTSETALLSQYFTVFDSLAISDLSISPQETSLIESEFNRIDGLTINSFKQMRANLISGRDAISDNIGGGDATYNSVYERSGLPKLLDKSTQQIVNSSQMQAGIDAITDILANSTTVLQSTAIVDPFAFARANANNPDIDIRSYSSGKLARLNYGESLETLALRTMGDPDRWIEIAIANGLKPPYVDEIGEKLPLIANGKNNTVNIAKSDAGGKLNKEKLYINQIVILQSSIERPPDQRVIVSIRQIPVSGELVIELDGEANLDKYKLADSAVVRVFKPNTVNSNFYVLIPSNDPSPSTLQQETPWFLRSKGQDERNAGVDFLIGENNDLSFTPVGDLQLSYGADNGLQALRILLSTAQGSLIKHADYGIVDVTGNKNSDAAQIRKTLAESVSHQILNDPRFDRLDFLTVESLGSASGYKVSVGVVLAGGGNNVIPITFQVNTPKS
jgi:hypothetical protein